MFADTIKDELIRKGVSRHSPIFMEDAFSRDDPSEDHIFYQKDRFVNHIDRVALETVENLIGTLVVEKDPVILDLMAGWNSHIPASLKPSRVSGIGLNENELRKNDILTGYYMQDINMNPELPYGENSFDVVINSLSVDYMTKPVELFREVGRVLKPGGLFLVIFSNRMFPQKAVKVWKESSEDERIILVEEFFRSSDMFEKPLNFTSKRKSRPKDDKYYEFMKMSDPVYAVYAEKKGGSKNRKKRPDPLSVETEKSGNKNPEASKEKIRETLCCPHCGDKMRKWLVPYNPFAYTWDNDFMYICFNDSCSYYTRGWDYMRKEGNSGSYRLMYNPEKNTCNPIPVNTESALKEGIIEEA